MAQGVGKNSDTWPCDFSCLRVCSFPKPRRTDGANLRDGLLTTPIAKQQATRQNFSALLRQPDRYLFTPCKTKCAYTFSCSLKSKGRLLL